MGKTAVAEYVDYATIHGVERIKNSPFAGFKILWLIALCGSLGMITFQVVMLYRKYDSTPVSTSMELKTVEKMRFPKVVICNTNPGQTTRLPVESGESGTENLFNIIHFKYEEAIRSNLTLEKAVTVAESFKLWLSSLPESLLMAYSQPFDEFVLSCAFAGNSCSPSSIGNHSTFRTYDYGLCYVFDPKKQDGISPSAEVSSSGQRFGLELLLNVDRDQSIHLVTSSDGVLICPLHDVSEYLDADSGVFVPTGFQANIAVSKSVTESVPGKNNESPMCDETSDTSVHDCLSDCRQKNIAQRCGCYQQFFMLDKVKVDSQLSTTLDNDTDYRPCLSSKDLVCILKALDEFTNSTPSGCKCISPCRNEFFTPEITLISFPNEKYTPIVWALLAAKIQDGPHPYEHGRTRLDSMIFKTRENVIRVRIYLKALSYEVIKESYAYEIANFISDIGGQLGLWAGFSVLSILELVELMFLLVAKKEKKENPTEPARNEPGDNDISLDTHKTELSDFD
ncbi:hypothetical protein DPMN_138666 [Dreissena polymorpha]|uniref:Uncharacterized protein n=1 Tax=Dreissena polymorpha TaxID=45954 RepID=A0A9D4JEX1_DREPO|nr:hypothetical protein DPMN_138666 [Dreissena polymorpha]